MKSLTMGAVLLSGLLSVGCGGEAAEPSRTAVLAAHACTCQWAFEQDGVLLAYPAPGGCALLLGSDGAPSLLGPCSNDMPDVYRPPPNYDRPPSHIP